MVELLASASVVQVGDSASALRGLDVQPPDRLWEKMLNLAAHGQQEKVQYISPVLALLALPPASILELLDQSLIDQRARPSSF